MKKFDDWLHDNAECVFGLLFFIVFCSFMLLASGCGGGLEVVAADRVMVPVRDAGDGRYLREESPACTGWYVPNATMIYITDKLNE